MNKKQPLLDLSNFSKSSFTLSFAIEILGIEVWHDCSEGWLDLGPCVQGFKIQYQLYPGQNFDLDILVWPHTAKIWCGSQYGWVRTWQFLDKRWLTFSIRHAFPVRVVELMNYTVIITPMSGISALSSNAKNDQNIEVYLPKLEFNERRYFATVSSTQTVLENYLWNMIWDNVQQFIPASFLDGKFDIPHSVSDNRHQDTILFYVKEAVLNKHLNVDKTFEMEIQKSKNEKVLKTGEKKKGAEVKAKFELKLTGDSILSGAGRVIPFESAGDHPQDVGDIIVILSSTNLPAQDDLPIVFVNVEKLTDIPVRAFQNYSLTHLYIKWKIGDEEYTSNPQLFDPDKTVTNLNDHHAMALTHENASSAIAIFLDDPFEIELRGICLPGSSSSSPKLFGYDKNDNSYGLNTLSETKNPETDILIAVAKINAKSLAKGVSGFIRGDFSLFPPDISIQISERDLECTNDINAIGVSPKPLFFMQPHIILESQMCLEASLGVVGCKPQRLNPSYSRLFCLVSDTTCIMALIKKVTDINNEIVYKGSRSELLTGFSLDTGSTVLFYVEGLKDGYILSVWEAALDIYLQVKPLFSSSSRYVSRIYTELEHAAMPFYVLKMYTPIGALLACPPMYTKPSIPIPARFILPVPIFKSSVHLVGSQHTAFAITWPPFKYFLAPSVIVHP